MMQAFRAAATVENDHGLHITDLPFQPGATVEVIVLEPSEETPGKLRPNRERAGRILSLAGSWADMPEDDYNALLEEIEQRRRHSGARRRRREAGLD